MAYDGVLPALESVLVFPLRELFELEQPLPIASQTAVVLSTWSFLALFYLPSQVIVYLIEKVHLKPHLLRQ